MTPTRRTKPSLALEAAALAYAEAVAALRAEVSAVVADHVKRTGSETGARTTQESFARLEPWEQACDKAEAAMGRAAVAFWKAERRRKAPRG